MAGTLIATEDGVKLANEALINLRINQTAFVKRDDTPAKATVSKFFNRKPISHQCFVGICDILNLEWSAIVESYREKEVSVQSSIASEISEQGNITTVATTRVVKSELQPISDATLTKKQPCLVFEIVSPIEQVDKKKLGTIVELLQIITSDTSIEIIDTQQNDTTFTLFLTGTPTALINIQTRYRSEELIKVKALSVKTAVVENLTRVNLSGLDLNGLNLSEADLSGADLSGANLRGANLSRSNLTGTDLNRADLAGANFSKANLIEANLREADLIEANFSGANLSKANFYGADLSGADLRETDLSGASLWKAYLWKTILWKAIFWGAILDEATVESARFGFNEGISSEMNRELRSRGAIFIDSEDEQFQSLIPLSF